MPIFRIGLKSGSSKRVFDAIHTGDLPQLSETDDLDIAKIADDEDRIVV